ncbi:MAG: terminase large subunit [bacterium]
MTSLRQTKGEWAGQPLQFMPWQDTTIRKVHGTLNADGFRQYRVVFVFVPRKNGKSTWAAAEAIYLTFADREPGAEVYGAAYDREQASIVFDQAAAMLKLTSRTSSGLPKWKEYKREKRIVVPGTNSKYEAIPAEAAGSHGFNAHGIIFDEFHTQRDRELYDVLATSTGSRRQPLIFIITTAGFDRESPCFRLYDYACKVRDGVIEDPTFLSVIFEAEKDDDWTSPETWEKANPGLGITVKREYIESECRKAQVEPAYENTFKRLHLNLWTTSETKAISAEAWKACAEEVREGDLEGLECVAGLDLASKIDVAAFDLLFRTRQGPLVVPRLFVPEDTIDERTRKAGVPYRTWADQGHLIATPGSRISYEWIEDQIRKDARRFELQLVGFDPWGSTQIVQRLGPDGEDVTQFVELRQGYKTLSDPTKELLAQVRSQELRHDGNPVLTWMADNLVLMEDPAGNMKPARNKSREKIDGMVALIMGLACLSMDPEVEDPEPMITVIGG